MRLKPEKQPIHWVIIFQEELWVGENNVQLVQKNRKKIPRIVTIPQALR